MDTATLLLLIALPFWLALLAWLWRTERHRQRPDDRDDRDRLVVSVLTAMHSVTGRPCYQTTGFPPVW
jgi:hypothetical protein